MASGTSRWAWHDDGKMAIATLTGLLWWDGRQRLAHSLNRTIPQMSRVPCAGEGNCDLFGEIWRWFAIGLPEELRKGALEVQL